MTSDMAMPPARRRRIPGMSSGEPARPAAALAAVTATPSLPAQADTSEATPAQAEMPAGPPPPVQEMADDHSRATLRHRSSDYGTTRVVNFRLPVDLHQRYKKLVRELEDSHPKLRHVSLTELVIALLEEGPTTIEQAAALIRRKRAAEHADG